VVLVDDFVVEALDCTVVCSVSGFLFNKSRLPQSSRNTAAATRAMIIIMTTMSRHPFAPDKHPLFPEEDDPSPPPELELLWELIVDNMPPSAPNPPDNPPPEPELPDDVLPPPLVPQRRGVEALPGPPGDSVLRLPPIILRLLKSLPLVMIFHTPPELTDKKYNYNSNFKRGLRNK
jgi:hypothetical protein